MSATYSQMFKNKNVCVVVWMYGVLCVWCACGMFVACVWHMYVCVVCVDCVLFVYVVGNVCGGGGSVCLYVCVACVVWCVCGVVCL